VAVVDSNHTVSAKRVIHHGLTSSLQKNPPERRPETP
jgi:hypothetical protein